jgi:hypothetical protein
MTKQQQGPSEPQERHTTMSKATYFSRAFCMERAKHWDAKKLQDLKSLELNEVWRWHNAGYLRVFTDGTILALPDVSVA